MHVKNHNIRRKLIIWQFTSAADKLSQRLLQTNPADGSSRTSASLDFKSCALESQ